MRRAAAKYSGTDRRYGGYEAVYCNNDLWPEFVTTYETKHSVELQAFALQTRNKVHHLQHTFQV
jgi:hypothetical protein